MSITSKIGTGSTPGADSVDSSTIINDSIVNADVNSTAAIALNKLAATTASRALASDASGFVTAATTTSTELGYVNGVTSAIQSQINGLRKFPEGTTINLGQSISGTTYTIHQQDGTALANTDNNRGYVFCRDSTGEVVPVAVTANVTLTFGATSDTDGNLFGITDADWSSVMPMFVGFIYDDTDGYFCIRRTPSLVSGAAAGNLAQKGDTDADGQDDVLIATTGLTLANWVDTPITQIGWFYATYATTGGAWTFSTSHVTGFNKNYTKIAFVFPQAQMGGATGSHLVANGGTVPAFTTQQYYYYVTEDNFCICDIYYDADAGTPGAGAFSSYISTPFVNKNGTSRTAPGLFFINTVSGGAYVSTSYMVTAESQFFFLAPTVSGSALQNSVGTITWGLFTSGDRTIAGSVRFKI